MDAAASAKSDAEFDKVYDLFLKIENSAFPTSIKQRHSIIKYTKLPDIDFDSKVTWHEETFSLKPRLRRVATINEPKLSSSRSLKPENAIVPKTRMPSITQRKIVTIEEDDENDLHPKFSQEGRKHGTKSCVAVGTEIKKDRVVSQRTTSRLSSNSKSAKDIKLSAKNNLLNNRKENDSAKLNYKNKYAVSEKFSTPNTVRSQKNKEKGVTRSNKSVYTASKIDVSKNIETTSENNKDISSIKNKLSDNWISNSTSKKMVEKQGINRSSQKNNRNKVSLVKDMNKPVTIIHVPLDEQLKKNEKAAEISESVLNATLDHVNKVNCSTEVEKIIFSKDMSVGTEAIPATVDQFTEIDTKYETICKCVEKTNIHTELKETFDSLDIPNVTLIKDKSSNISKDNEVNFYTNSLPNMQASTYDTQKYNNKNETDDPQYSKSTSYIISRATLTYTTKQKINFHVVGKNDKISSDLSTSPLTYPMSVVSLFKQEVNNQDLCKNSEIILDRNYDQVKKYNSINAPQTNFPQTFDSSKLVKPSDIISTIETRNGLFQSDYISEQFQRELNFIDSFFESLQYLEHCSLAEKCLSDSKVESCMNKDGFDLKQLDYGSLLSKFDNEIHVDDTETMASKSLCLLNLLIRDEQRRAKNLLFVLKMREDALKDFTKSQILWLENKKKQVNTDISTLKKKQRGALLKLQHECGEMHRMRKALLTLSEKRKGALIKTKKNIELQLKNSIHLDQILSGKKKIKRVSDRSLAPVKCFDLSSSGCDESTTSRPRSETPVPSPDIPATIDIISSAEKSIQTGDSILVMTDQSTNTTDENFLVVDGGYLNIIFHNLSLPQMFSSGKQYEVNEEALKNIVNTTNVSRNKVNEGGDIKRFMDQIKNYEVDRSTSPSTARSLVEEFDQYYKVLVDDDKAMDSKQVKPVHTVICEVRNTVIQKVETADSAGAVDDAEAVVREELGVDRRSDTTLVSRGSVECDRSPVIESVCVSEVIVESVAGPLPVPAGAAAAPDTQPPDALTWMSQKTSSTSTSSDLNSSSGVTISSIPSDASPVHYEAEELRRQQLAIEKEIKALEQQQCQLLVVREIPDKPPPPYTLPNEPRTPKPPRMFLLDDASEQKISKFISNPSKNTFDCNDPFDIFVKDFCKETLKKHRPEKSDKPWHSCNLLPQKPPDGVEKTVTRATSHLSQVLRGVTPTVVSGVGARRSDQIDDILFAEWRECEPEWTTLHVDEAVVKNQLFESIFQRILSETVDEYKRTVLSVSDEVSLDV